MHVFFSGIGGTGIGPLALIAHQAGFEVSGSDKQDSQYIRYLMEQGITDIHINQTYDEIAAVHAADPIDWFVYTSALPIENPDAPELKFCSDKHIKNSKRDEFINLLLKEKGMKLVAIAGTHGKTTTTAMAIWAFKQLGIPVSYSVGAKISFGEMGHFESGSEFFVYEADEFDRNFLAFHPYLALITGVDWDHPDTYPTREEYYAAFREFLRRCKQAVSWQDDMERLGIEPGVNDTTTIIDKSDPKITSLSLLGLVNRQNAMLVAAGLAKITDKPVDELFGYLDKFPGVTRRFEQIAPGLYSDYAHTPSKIRGALQLAREVAGDNVVVVYEGLHNTRQHFIKEELVHLFDNVKQLYIVPSYLAREDKSLKLLTPTDLRGTLSPETRTKTEPAEFDETLRASIDEHLQAGDLVLCITAGGGHSLDEWLRQEFKS